MPQTRKIAAIMFTDIVGYTALMGNDEEKAIQILELNRNIHKGSLQEFNGTWLKEKDDSVLASFATVTDAVLCAQKIREVCEKEGQHNLRIGIHQGELVFENEDVFGEGVNLASGIQAAAPAGGIFMSDAVAKKFDNKKGFGINYAGEKNLKNFIDPVDVYELLKPVITPVIKPETPSTAFKYGRAVPAKREGIVLALVLLGLAVVVYLLIKFL